MQEVYLSSGYHKIAKSMPKGERPMRKKIITFFIIGFGLLLLLPPSSQNYSVTSVFRMTDEPVAITRGTFGSALTVNISFGDNEVHEWVEQLEKPYPLLLIDTEWANRFPETVRLITKKNIPTGLLGKSGAAYEADPSLLLTELKKFESSFNIKPLWFRTEDEVFPHFLHTLLWEAELNALGSSFVWDGGKLPPVTEGEIISVPHHRKSRVNLSELKRLSETREFHSIEDVLFGVTVKSKKIPK